MRRIHPPEGGYYDRVSETPPSTLYHERDFRHGLLGPIGIALNVCVPSADNIPAMPVHDLPRERRDDVAEMLRTALSAENDVPFAYLHGSFLSDASFRDVVDLAVYSRARR